MMHSQNETSSPRVDITEALGEWLLHSQKQSGLTIQVDPEGFWYASCLGTTWKPTGLDFAAFPEEATELLGLFPMFPYVTARLEVGLENFDGLEGLAKLSEGFLNAAEELKSLAQSMQSEVDLMRVLMKKSSFGDWHINGFDPWALPASIKVAGRDLFLSAYTPLGEPKDLSTIFLGPILQEQSSAGFRPPVKVTAVNIGTKQLKVVLRNARRVDVQFWIDLADFKVTKAP